VVVVVIEFELSTSCLLGRHLGHTLTPNVTFICKKIIDLLYYDICFIAVVWNQTQISFMYAHI
jgi:hypothetical protein